MADEQVKRKLIEPATADQKPAPSSSSPDDEPISIAKPSDNGLDRFRSKRSPSIAGVETLLPALPYHSMAEAKDWVRLHPNEEEYWSPEFCFVQVPIKGQKRETLHLIDEELAMLHLPSGRILRFRLALATKPHDAFFLCRVPSQTWITHGTKPTCRHAVGPKHIGRKQPAEKGKTLKATRSPMPGIRTRFPSQIGQSRRWMKSSA
jgi:hypothetical protein